MTAKPKKAAKQIIKLPFFKSFIYSYLRMGIPILLGIKLPQDLHLITLADLKWLIN